MPLTKKETAQLNDILGKMKIAEAYILNPDISIHSAQFNCYITKEYGCNLAYLYRAIESLDAFLNPVLETED